MDTIALGTGILGWSGRERITDRYGTVHLNRAPDGADFNPARFDTAPIGTRGQLVAVILHTRRSPHCGDWARGLTPTTPDVGEEVTLGVGTLIVNGRSEIGLAPDDGRSHDWLTPEALYHCHNQTVRLELRPDGHQ